MGGGTRPQGYVDNPNSDVDPLGLANYSLYEKIINAANKVASPGGEITSEQAKNLRENLPVIQSRSVFQNQVARK